MECEASSIEWGSDCPLPKLFMNSLQISKNLILNSSVGCMQVPLTSCSVFEVPTGPHGCNMLQLTHDAISVQPPSAWLHVLLYVPFCSSTTSTTRALVVSASFHALVDRHVRLVLSLCLSCCQFRKVQWFDILGIGVGTLVDTPYT